MLGQLWVVPELEPPVPVPVLEEFDVDDGVVVDEPEVEPLDVEPVPVFPVEPVVDVVAALATSAPPATRPELSAPMAITLRIPNGMGVPFVVCDRPARAGTAQPAPCICVSQHNDVGECSGFRDESMTILRTGLDAPAISTVALRICNARAQVGRRRSVVRSAHQRLVARQQ